MVDKARSFALNGLNLIFTEEGYSNKFIDNTCKKHITEPKERALFTRLFLGTIEKKIFIDALIKEVSNIPIKKIRPVVLNILRMSVYQLYFMDSVPDHATVNLALKLCEERKFGGLKGFVNAVLRNIANNKESLKKKVLSTKGIKGLSIEYSMPEWLIEYWMEFLSEDQVKSILSKIDEPKNIILRVNQNKIEYKKAIELIEKTQISFKEIEELNAVTLKNAPGIEHIPGFNEGYYYIMDTASIKAIDAANIKTGYNIIDVCSAPGGKGLYAAYKAGKSGQCILRDLYDQKVELIKENAKLLGCDNVIIERWNAKDPDEKLFGKMDLCIADLPCSCLGSIGTKPEIRYRMDMDKIKSLAKVQEELLDVSVQYVKPGGTLLYSTCTISKNENEDNVKSFLDRHPEFSVEKSELLLPINGDNDGFFYCVLKNNGHD